MDEKKAAQNNKSGGEKHRFRVFALAAVVLVIIAGVALTAVLGNKDANRDRTVGIKTTYLTVQFPKKYERYLKYQELVQGNDATVVFTMVHEEVEAELFRLSFTEAAPEEYAGYFSTDNAELYVAIKASGFDHGIFGTDHTEEDLEAQEEIRALYYAMLDGMSTVMDSVRQDTRFSEIRGVSESDKQEWTLSYWKVSLPSAMTCAESEQDGVYQATFTCNIGGKAVSLYTVCLGDSDGESAIGYYTANGEKRMVSVKPHDIQTDTLSQEELEIVYAMMDTVNDVLQAIRQDKNFSEGIEPAA